LGQRAQVFSPVSAAVDAYPLSGGPGECLDHGGRDRLLPRAFRHRLGAVGIGLGLIAYGLEAGDTLPSTSFRPLDGGAPSNRRKARYESLARTGGESRGESDVERMTGRVDSCAP